MTDEHSHSHSQPEDRVAAYVAEHAPELDPAEVRAFLGEHPKPDDEPADHLAWAVRTMRERREGEHGDGLGVERVVREIRRLDR